MYSSPFDKTRNKERPNSAIPSAAHTVHAHAPKAQPAPYSFNYITRVGLGALYSFLFRLSFAAFCSGNSFGIRESVVCAVQFDIPFARQRLYVSFSLKQAEEGEITVSVLSLSFFLNLVFRILYISHILCCILCLAIVLGGCRC